MKTELYTPMPAALTRSRGLVLIVDDEENNRMLLRDTLEAHGYKVIEAEDGESALREIVDHAPDVILLDVMMPGIDGFEVCRRVKSHARTASVPVLIITASTERKERMMGIAAGANDFLSKPVDLQDLTLRVRNAVQVSRLFQQLEAEQEKAERLLSNLLPTPVAQRMKQGEISIADHHADATVLIADLAGFTGLSSLIGPDQVVGILNEIFSAFDDEVERHRVEKIKTVGDTYIVAGGLTDPQGDHTGALARLALGLQARVNGLNLEYKTSLRARIGISTGPLVSGVIGRKSFSYDIWGQTVNVAAFLRGAAEPGSIVVSEAAYDRLKSRFQFGEKRTKTRGQQVMAGYPLLPG